MAKTTSAAPEPSPDMAKMQQSELDELHSQVQAIVQNDFRLGNVLLALVRHIGGAHGLSVTPDTPAPTEEGESDAN